MPGRAPRGNETKLSPKQQQIARKVIKAVFDPALGIQQWSEDEKAALAHKINAQYAAIHEAPVYTVRKLEDWISNAKYRATCKSKRAHPTSWTLQSRTQARAKARERQRKGNRSWSTQRNRTLTGDALSGEAETPVYKRIRETFESGAGISSQSSWDYSWHASTSDEFLTNTNRAAEYQVIRNKFEAEKYGRTDMFASHRGPSSADGACEQAHAPMEWSGGGAMKLDGQLVATFLTIPKLPIPSQAESSTGIHMDAEHSGFLLSENVDDCAGKPVEGIPLESSPRFETRHQTAIASPVLDGWPIKSKYGVGDAGVETMVESPRGVATDGYAHADYQTVREDMWGQFLAKHIESLPAFEADEPRHECMDAAMQTPQHLLAAG